MRARRHTRPATDITADVVNLLGKLARRGARIVAASSTDTSVEICQPHATGLTGIGKSTAAALRFATKQGWIAPDTDPATPVDATAPPHLTLTPSGRHALKFARARRTLARTSATQPPAVTIPRQRPQRNLAESPLDWLRNRSDTAGVPMITAAQHEAGERLRSDLTLAGLTPRLTMSWSGLPSARASRRSGASHAPSNQPDVMVAARQRVNRALAAVGPEHAGILIDVCGHLKGLEAIATAEGWPRRSAKIILQRALTALARHYGIIAPVSVDRAIADRLRHWGATDYRPTLHRWSDGSEPT